MIIDKEKINKIMKLRDEGKSIRQISILTNVPKSTIHRYVQINEEKIKDANYDNFENLTDLQKRIIRFQREGLNEKQIMTKFNSKLGDVIKKEVTKLYKMGY